MIRYKVMVETEELPEGEVVYQMDLGDGPILVHEGIDPETSPYFQRRITSGGRISKAPLYAPPCRPDGTPLSAIPLFGNETLKILVPEHGDE